MQLDCMKLTRLQSTPSSDIGSPAQEGGILLWQADWLDVVLVVGIAIQDQDGDVKAIRLRSKSKIGMQPDFRYREHLVGQGFDVRVEDVVPQRHTDRGRVMLGPGDTVTSCHHVLGANQCTATPGSTDLDKGLSLVVVGEGNEKDKKKSCEQKDDVTGQAVISGL